MAVVDIVVGHHMPGYHRLQAVAVDSPVEARDQAMVEDVGILHTLLRHILARAKVGMPDSAGIACKVGARGAPAVERKAFASVECELESGRHCVCPSACMPQAVALGKIVADNAGAVAVAGAVAAAGAAEVAGAAGVAEAVGAAGAVGSAGKAVVEHKVGHLAGHRVEVGVAVAVAGQQHIVVVVLAGCMVLAIESASAAVIGRRTATAAVTGPDTVAQNLLGEPQVVGFSRLFCHTTQD